MSIFKLGDFSDSNIVTRKKWTGSFGGFGGGGDLQITSVLHCYQQRLAV